MGSVTPKIMGEALMHHLRVPEHPRWYMESIPPANPSELQEEQLKFFTKSLELETNEHNKSRANLQRYLGLALAHERALCAERGCVRYLNTIIADLRVRFQNEEAKRFAAEDKIKSLSIENQLERDFWNVEKIHNSPVRGKSANSSWTAC
jgi:hypothetical protein